MVLRSSTLGVRSTLLEELKQECMRGMHADESCQQNSRPQMIDPALCGYLERGQRRAHCVGRNLLRALVVPVPRPTESRTRSL